MAPQFPAKGSYDAFDVICKKANDVGAWVHIDGAFGLWAILKYLGKSGVQELKDAPLLLFKQELR